MPQSPFSARDILGQLNKQIKQANSADLMALPGVADIGVYAPYQMTAPKVVDAPLVENLDVMKANNAAMASFNKGVDAFGEMTTDMGKQIDSAARLTREQKAAQQNAATQDLLDKALSASLGRDVRTTPGTVGADGTQINGKMLHGVDLTGNIKTLTDNIEFKDGNWTRRKELGTAWVDTQTKALAEVMDRLGLKDTEKKARLKTYKDKLNEDITAAIGTQPKYDILNNDLYDSAKRTATQLAYGAGTKLGIVTTQEATKAILDAEKEYAANRSAKTLDEERLQRARERDILRERAARGEPAQLSWTDEASLAMKQFADAPARFILGSGAPTVLEIGASAVGGTLGGLAGTAVAPGVGTAAGAAAGAGLAGSAVGSITSVGESVSQLLQELDAMPEAELRGNKQFQQILQANGGDFARAKNAFTEILADDVGTRAAVIGGTIGALNAFGGVAGSMVKKAGATVGKEVVETGAGGIIKGTLSKFGLKPRGSALEALADTTVAARPGVGKSVAEIATEGLKEGGEEVALQAGYNRDMQQAGFNRQLTDELAGNFVGGALAGTTIGAGFKAGGAVKDAAMLKYAGVGSTGIKIGDGDLVVSVKEDDQGMPIVQRIKRTADADKSNFAADDRTGLMRLIESTPDEGATVEGRKRSIQELRAEAETVYQNNSKILGATALRDLGLNEESAALAKLFGHAAAATMYNMESKSVAESSPIRIPGTQEEARFAFDADGTIKVAPGVQLSDQASAKVAELVARTDELLSQKLRGSLQSFFGKTRGEPIAAGVKVANPAQFGNPADFVNTPPAGDNEVAALLRTGKVLSPQADGTQVEVSTAPLADLFNTKEVPGSPRDFNTLLNRVVQSPSTPAERQAAEVLTVLQQNYTRDPVATIQSLPALVAARIEPILKAFPQAASQTTQSNTQALGNTAAADSRAADVLFGIADANSNVGTMAEKEVAKALLGVFSSGKIPLPKFQEAPSMAANGDYNLGTHTVRIRRFTPKTILHEMLHAATAKGLAEIDQAAARGDQDAKDIVALVKHLHAAAKSEAAKQGVTLYALKSYSQFKTDGTNESALSVPEMQAELFQPAFLQLMQGVDWASTNPPAEAQRALTAMQGKTGTMFDTFTELVRKVLSWLNPNVQLKQGSLAEVLSNLTAEAATRTADLASDGQFDPTKGRQIAADATLTQDASPRETSVRETAIRAGFLTQQQADALARYVPVENPAFIDEHKRIADAYETLPVFDPEALPAYADLARETTEQYAKLIESGLQVVAWEGRGEPYQNSREMLADLQNGQLKFLKTENAFGESGGNRQNPMLHETGYTVPTSNGGEHTMLVNDMFRVVHDWLAHGAYENGFGPLGEEKAWRIHMATLKSEGAKRALTAETRGQNSWVNYGPHLRTEDGTIPGKGEAGYRHPSRRPFAEQKTALLPDWAMDTDNGNADGVLYDTRKPSLTRAVRQASKRLDEGKLTAEGYQTYVNEALQRLDDAKLNAPVNPRVRGELRLRERVMQAVREGSLDRRALDLLEWFVAKNPNLANDVAISVRQAPEGDEYASGNYDTLRRLITLFKDSDNTTTAVHELLHHAERMMPEDIQNAVRKDWLEAKNRAASRAQTPAEQLFFKALDSDSLLVNASGAPEALLNLLRLNSTGFDKGNRVNFSRKFLLQFLLGSGQVPYAMYQYTSPSEFWAVNATRIVESRFENSATLVGKIKQWLGELVQKVKGLFGLPSDAPVLKALQSLASSDGTFVSDTMLEENDPALLADVKNPRSSVDTTKAITTGEDAAPAGNIRTLVRGTKEQRKTALQNIKNVLIEQFATHLQPVHLAIEGIPKTLQPFRSRLSSALTTAVDKRDAVLMEAMSNFGGNEMFKALGRTVRRLKVSEETVIRDIGYWITVEYAKIKHERMLLADQKNIDEARQALDSAIGNMERRGAQAKLDEAIKTYNDRKYAYDNGTVNDGVNYGPGAKLLEAKLAQARNKLAALEKARATDAVLTQARTDVRMAEEELHQHRIGLVGGVNKAKIDAIQKKVEATYGKVTVQEVAKHLYRMNAFRTALDIESGRLSPEMATAYSPELAELEAEMRKLRGTVRSQTATQKQIEVARNDFVRKLSATSKYVPTTGSPNSSNEGDILGAGFKTPNVAEDKRMQGRSSGIADNAISASMGGLLKSATAYGWRDFSAGIAELYDSASAQERSDMGMTVSDVTILDRLSDNMIIHDGKGYTFGGEKVMQAIRKENVDGMGVVMRKIAKPMQAMAYMMTQLNFPFAPKNMIRDTWERTENVRTVKLYAPDGKGGMKLLDSNKIANQALGNTLGVLRDLRAFIWSGGKKGADTENMQYYREALENGFGGSRRGEMVPRERRDLVDAIEKATSKPAEARAALAEVVHRWNVTFDSVAPLSIYIAMRKNGMTKKDAAAETKKLMDFRAVGAAMPPARVIWAFAQPAVTGGYNMMKMLSTRTGQVRFAGYLAGFLAVQTALAAAAGDDEELNKNKLELLDEYTKDRALPIPVGDGIAKLPIGFGMPMLANTLVRIARGSPLGANDLEWKDVGGEVIGRALLPAFSPLDESKIKMSDSPFAFLIQTFAPTAAEPLINVAVNRGPFGAKIVKDEFLDKDLPKNVQGTPYTAAEYHNMAKFLYSITGGSLDVAPEQVRAVTEGYFAGVPKEILKFLVTNPNKQALGQNVNVPLVDAFYGRYNETAKIGEIQNFEEEGLNAFKRALVALPEDTPKKERYDAALDYADTLEDRKQAETLKVYIEYRQAMDEFRAQGQKLTRAGVAKGINAERAALRTSRDEVQTQYLNRWYDIKHAN